MTMTRIIRIALLVLAATVLTAACGEDTSVGEGVGIDVKGEAERLSVEDGTTTTLADEGDPGSEQRAAVGEAAPTTTAPPVTTTTASIEDRVAITISINGDESGTTQFEPSAARVFAGSLVRWVNQDVVARSIVANNGAFDSGMLEPGDDFIWEASAAGQFDYTDSTRPYAVGSVEVVPR